MKVFICFIRVFPISVVQRIFKFVNIFVTIAAFLGKFYNWSFDFFIGFNCKDNRKITWQVSLYYGWLKVIEACYTSGDNVVCDICWMSGYPCWFICQMNHIIVKHKIQNVLHIFICFKTEKVNAEISRKYYIFQIFTIFWKSIFKVSFILFDITVR